MIQTCPSQLRKISLFGMIQVCILSINFIATTQASDDTNIDLIEDHAPFDDLELDLDEQSLDDITFDQAYDNNTNATNNMKLLLGHQIGISRLANWDIFNQESWLRIGWAQALNDWLYTEIEAESSLFWPNDPIYNQRETPSYHSEFNLAFLQASVGSWSASLGKYTIGWGEIEGADILDIINPRKALTSGEVEDTYGVSNGQLFFSFDWYISTDHVLSGFYNLSPEFSEGFPEPNTDDHEWGIKLSSRIANAEIGLYAASLLPNIATFNPNAIQRSIEDQTTDTTIASPFSLWGFSTNYAIGRALLKLDLAYKQNLTLLRQTQQLIPAQQYAMPEPQLFPLTLTNLALSEHDRIDIGAGVEYTTANEQQLMLMVSHQTLQSYTDNLVIVGEQSLFPQARHTTQLITSFSDTYYHEDISLDISAASSINGDLSIIATQISWILNNNWRTELAIIKSFADDNSPATSFNGENLVSARIVYQF